MISYSYGKSVVIEIKLRFGVSAMKRVIREFGGLSVYVPNEGSEKHADLRKKFGADVADYLCNALGGLDIEFPSLNSVEQEERRRLLYADAANMDLALNEVVRRHGVSRRWVQMLRQRFRNQLKAG